MYCDQSALLNWGLRDYQADKRYELGSEKVPDCLGWARRVNCAEHDWDNGCHVCRIVLVIREGRRVLRDDGTLWLNYGDTYASGGAGGGTTYRGGTDGAYQRKMRNQRNGDPDDQSMDGRRFSDSGLPSGNLVGIPWRVALALQADGWVLRQDIVWHKPSPMPESVTNRCTKAHEYVFLLTKKGSGYYCDMEAIKEKSAEGRAGEKAYGNKTNTDRGDGGTRPGEYRDTSNKRSVWTVASQGYPGAHFATFPPKLIEPCILAGTSEKGACAKCGAPWRRVVEERKLTRERPNEYVKRNGAEGTGNSCSNSVAGVEVETVGWVPTCACCGEPPLPEPPTEPSEGSKDYATKLAKYRQRMEVWQSHYERVREASADEPIRPCVVLDTFIGSGTSCVVSLEHGRSSIGIDLSEDYLRFNAIPRIEGFMLDVPYLRALLPVREITRRGHALGTPKPE